MCTSEKIALERQLEQQRVQKERIQKELDTAPTKWDIFIQKMRTHSNPFVHPYRSENYTILLVNQGYIDVQLDLALYHLEKNSITLIPPKSVIYFQQFSKDLHFVTLSFSKAFAIHHTQQEKNAFTQLASPAVHQLKSTSIQQQTVLNLCDLVDQKNKQKNQFPSYKEAIYHLFALFLLELQEISKSNPTALKQKATRKEQLTLQFLEQVQANFRTEKKIRFYANELCVSERYLAKVIKEKTSKTIGELIDQAQVVEAQLLLVNSTLSITEIAESLHFTTTSFFGKFFKRKVGCSPRAYRKKM